MMTTHEERIKKQTEALRKRVLESERLSAVHAIFRRDDFWVDYAQNEIRSVVDSFLVSRERAGTISFPEIEFHFQDLEMGKGAEANYSRAVEYYAIEGKVLVYADTYEGGIQLDNLKKARDLWGVEMELPRFAVFLVNVLCEMNVDVVTLIKEVVSYYDE